MSLMLASASARRSELLQQLGLDFTTQSMNVDESVLTGENVETYVQRVTRLKIEAALTTCAHDDVVIAADTTVNIDKKILGKPQNQEDCIQMLLSLSGRQHRVLTSVMVARSDQLLSKLSITEVTFRALKRAEAVQYWLTGEPQGKAGGYAIQGLGAMFVAKIEGSYTGVMGLPLYELAQLLTKFDVKVLQQ